MEAELWDFWPRLWEDAADACRRKGGQAEPIVVGAPADDEAIDDLEDELDQELPEPVCDVLTGFSGELRMGWHLPDDVYPPAFVDSVWGGWHFSPSSILEAERSRRSWVTECFPNPDDPYDAIWHDKLGLLSITNGDIIAADTSVEPSPVVYLSHDDGEGHGLRLGSDFVDFVDRWSRLCCLGPEDWVWLPFYDRKLSALDPNGPRARAWRDWMGVRW